MATQSERQFIELYEANWRPVLGYALRRSDSAEAAADVVAETFLVAWRRIDSVPAGNQARPWLFGVARRVLSNGRRSSMRKSRLGEQLQQHLATAPSQRWDETSETGVLVNAAMSNLDADERELLRLTSWEGLTPTEIAVATGMPATTVRTRLRRARSRLRGELVELGWEAERSDRPRNSESEVQTLTLTAEKDT